MQNDQENDRPVVRAEPLENDEGRRERLVELEHKIRRGLKTFIEVGEALIEIRESKLYLLDHKTFAEYCLKQWNFTSRFAQMQMAGTRVARELLEANNCSPPMLESQVRVLMQVEPERRVEVWQLANEFSSGKQPTAMQIRLAIRERRDREIARRIEERGGITIIRAEVRPPVDTRTPEEREAERRENMSRMVHSQLSEFCWEIQGNGFSLDDILAEVEQWLRNMRKGRERGNATAAAEIIAA